MIKHDPHDKILNNDGSQLDDLFINISGFRETE